MGHILSYREASPAWLVRCGQWGWRVCLPMGLGAIAACGFQPLALWPSLLLGVAGLIALVARAPDWRGATLAGWLWGVGHFALGDNWIATAFTYQAKMPTSLGVLAVFLLSLYLALFPALAALGAWFARERRTALVLAFAGCWIVTEWMRGWVLTGFAWNPLGVALLGDFAHPGLASLAPWLGTYALSGLAVVLAGALWAGVSLWLEVRSERRRSVALAAGPFALVLAAMASPPHGGNLLQGHVPYTLVQPDIPQDQLNDPRYFEDQFIKTARLSLDLHPGVRRLVLWPESGVPDYLREGYPPEYYRETTFAGDPTLARMRIGRVIGAGNTLLTGSIDLEMAQGRVTGARNVVTGLDGEGRIVASYTKAHLVPFGEYLPLRRWLKPLGIERLVPGDMDFTAGPGPRTVDLGALGKVGLQICYEIVFSGEVVDPAYRPDYIFNPTNDGWFGSWGPPQHLAQARLRAIEEGLPILRSTTNGISAVIDADGIVRQSAGRDVAARMDAMVPPAHAPTLFARMGNMLPLAWAAILLVAAALVLRRRRG